VCLQLLLLLLPQAAELLLQQLLLQLLLLPQAADLLLLLVRLRQLLQAIMGLLTAAAAKP
jgi:hypothetical protein